MMMTQKHQRALLIAAIAAQLLIPLTYYVRDDAFDERFAWRMFSAIRLADCETTVTAEQNGATSQLSPAQDLHQAWVSHLARNRVAVIEGYLSSRCRALHADTITLQNRCHFPGDEEARTVRYELTCASRVLTTRSLESAR